MEEVQKENRLIQNEDILDQKANEIFGVPYLYPYQRLAISNILEVAGIDLDANSDESDLNETHHDADNDVRKNQIIILPTGSGKSLIFSLSATFLPKLTVIVFPLLALISDQYRRLKEAGVATVVIKGGQSKGERKEALDQIARGDAKIVVSNPETLISPKIRKVIADAGVSQFIIDETHIVSEWGDSFRPAYQTLGETIHEVNPTLVCALTATASTHIYNRIREILFLGKEVYLLDANPDRTNILYEVHPVLSVERHLVKLVQTEQRPAIIFCSSRTSAEMTARMLRFSLPLYCKDTFDIKNKFHINKEEIRFYHAGLERSEKESLEKWFFSSDDGILCSTCAYGMGMDKKNVKTVIHRELPSSVESYLQESGRGGRDQKQAKAILLYSPLEVKRRKRMKTDLEKSRFDALLAYASGINHKCRREELLAMINAEPEDCDLCDVCRGTAKLSSAGEDFLRIFFRHNSGVFTKEEAVYVLKGIKSPKIRENYLTVNGGFGMLKEWSVEAIEEAVDVLIFLKVIKVGGKIFRGRRVIYRG